VPFVEHICDVCRLLDDDTALKPCQYCKFCDSWICQKDLDNWTRRALAAAKRLLEPSFKGDPNYKIEGE
jgi:hypothetical protein